MSLIKLVQSQLLLVVLVQFPVIGVEVFLVEDSVEALAVLLSALCLQTHTSYLRGVQVLHLNVTHMHVVITVSTFDHFFFFKLLKIKLSS